MEDMNFLGLMDEFSLAMDEAMTGLGFGGLKNGNVEEILAGESKTKERYLAVKDAEKRIEQICSEYKNEESSLKKLLDKAVRWEKATGGEVIHRGYYNPSPIADIVIGGNQRGKLLKRPTAKSKITYEYGFDSEGKMLVALTNTEVGVFSEYFVERDGIVYAVSFDPDGRVYAVCEEFWNEGKPLSFTIAFFDGEELRSMLQHECFSYNERGSLEKGEMLELTPLAYKRERPDLVSHRIYEFVTDSEGYLQKYNLSYDESPAFDNKAEWTAIKIKRKI